MEVLSELWGKNGRCEMTREEAIEYIKTNCYGEYCEDDWRNAMDMAIRSLEAWDNLVKEMEEEIYHYDAMPDVWYGISESFDIIKKHLKFTSILLVVCFRRRWYRFNINLFFNCFFFIYFLNV